LIVCQSNSVLGHNYYSSLFIRLLLFE